MRIDLNTPVTNNTSTEKPAKPSANPNRAAQSTPTDANASEDTVSLSRLAAKALESPEIRQDKVDQLRQAVSSGQYQIDPSSIAEAMLKNKRD